MKLTRTVQNVQAKKKPAKQVAVVNESGMRTLESGTLSSVPLSSGMLSL